MSRSKGKSQRANAVTQNWHHLTFDLLPLTYNIGTNMNGLISFFASHHAIRAETVLKRNGLATQLIPGPKDLSPNCGVALRFDYAQRESALAFLAAKNVQIDGVHVYRPRTDSWNVRHGVGTPT